MAILALVLALAVDGTADPKTALRNYVTAPDATYAWKTTEWEGHPALRLTSQTWHGHLWEHDVVLCKPAGRLSSETWVVHVTGSEPNAFDVDWSQSLADQSGCPVAVLFQIPNQPLWDKKEDDLIAHTFEQYLTTGDETWPLLFPMVKSATKTMDAVQAYDKGAQKFVVFGASKRGWTSWLTAASGDKRIAGIAPMLFDNLDMPRQLAKQLKDWGEFSPMIGDYTSRHLEETVESTEGKRLVAMIDPASYLGTIKVPVLAIHGANDPYWTVDASSLYWDDVKGPKWMVTVPNLGHAFELTEWWTPSLAAFVRMCSQGAKGHRAWADLRSVRERRWTAESDSLHFDASRWSDAGAAETGRYRASFQARRFDWDGLGFWLTDPVRVEKADRAW